MEVTIVRAEAIAIEETPDKLTIILDKETMRLSEYPVNGVPVEELNGYIDEMASSMNLLSKRRLFARDIMTGAKAATAACIRGLENHQEARGQIMTIRYVECAHCGEVVGTYYVTCPYCGYKLAARRSPGMDPLYGMTDDEFYKRFRSM